MLQPISPIKKISSDSDYGYNNIDTHQYSLAIFKELEGIDPPYGSIGFPHELSHQNDSANLFTEQIEPIESDLGTCKFKLNKI